MANSVNYLKEVFGGNNAGFIGIKGYKSSSTGEVADHLVNTFKYGLAVERSIKLMEGVDKKAFCEQIAQESGIVFEVVTKAFDDVYSGLVNNQNKETASTQALAQQDVYTVLTPNVKVHNQTGELYIHAMAVNKKVIVEGEYKKVNSRPLTLAKKAIKKALDLPTEKYRNFKLNGDNVQDRIKVKGNTIIFV